MGCKLGIDPRQVENRSDLANQVIVGNGLFNTKRVKQPTLLVIEPPHHRPTPPRIVSERRNHCSREPSTTFATKSATNGHSRNSAAPLKPRTLSEFPCTSVRASSASQRAQLRKKLRPYNAAEPRK